MPFQAPETTPDRPVVEVLSADHRADLVRALTEGASRAFAAGDTKAALVALDAVRAIVRDAAQGTAAAVVDLAGERRRRASEVGSRKRPRSCRPRALRPRTAAQPCEAMSPVKPSWTTCTSLARRRRRSHPYTVSHMVPFRSSTPVASRTRSSTIRPRTLLQLTAAQQQPAGAPIITVPVAGGSPSGLLADTTPIPQSLVFVDASGIDYTTFGELLWGRSTAARRRSSTRMARRAIRSTQALPRPSAGLRTPSLRTHKGSRS